MSAETDWTTICPHCGYISEDDAMCRACGALLEEELPVRPFSVREVLAGISEALDSADSSAPGKLAGFPGEEGSLFREEPEFCPSWRHYPGNIYYKLKI